MDQPPIAPYAAAAPRRARPLDVRLWSLAVVTGCLVVLGTAAYLKPNRSGMGTHQQLGLAPCGMIVFTGYPCPTCGMTTAFAYTVRGQLISAALAQPAGLLLALGTVAALGVSFWSLLTGQAPRIQIPILSPLGLLTLLLVLLLGGWGLKIVIGLLSGTLPVTSVMA